AAAREPYRYSPLVTVLFVPFSLLPDALGGVLWRLLNAAVYLGGMAWWARVGLPGRLTRHQRAVLFLLTVPLAGGRLNNGQSHALVIGLLFCAVAGVNTGRWSLAALCAALAALLKVYPVAVALLLAVAAPRRFGGRFGAALALGLALPFLFQQ